MKIIGLRCDKCGDIIYSTDRHDFKRCKCGGCFVDGGRDYFRYGGNNFTQVECCVDNSYRLVKVNEVKNGSR